MLLSALLPLKDEEGYERGAAHSRPTVQVPRLFQQVTLTTSIFMAKPCSRCGISLPTTRVSASSVSSYREKRISSSIVTGALVVVSSSMRSHMPPGYPRDDRLSISDECMLPYHGGGIYSARVMGLSSKITKGNPSRRKLPRP